MGDNKLSFNQLPAKLMQEKLMQLYITYKFLIYEINTKCC